MRFIPVSYLFRTSVGHLGSGCAHVPVRSERNRAAQNAKQKRIRLRLEDLDQNSSCECVCAQCVMSGYSSVLFHTSTRVLFHIPKNGTVSYPLIRGMKQTLPFHTYETGRRFIPPIADMAIYVCVCMYIYVYIYIYIC